MTQDRMHPDDLVKMQPSRKKPKEGDVFVIQPKPERYLYGRVMRINLPNVNPVMSGFNLIYVYRDVSGEMTMPSSLDSKRLLFPPCIVNNQGWLKGYFQTIGAMPIKEEDWAEGYGFFDFLSKQCVDEEGRPLEFTPEPERTIDFGIGGYGAIAWCIKQALEKDTGLLE